ncbi:MAG: BA14K family protein [Bauldia sp.]
MTSRTRTIVTSLAAAAMLAVGTLAVTAPAAEAGQYNWQQNQNNWQWRQQHRNQHYNGYNNNGGNAVAAGILGLIAGTFLGTAISQSNHTVSYCVQHFKSYDIGSRTYLGFDGFRHSCG